jgi:4,5-DOPA dioxygenase extradiol
VTAMARPRTIHDFFGFPQDLFDVEYPAPGSPEIAAEVVDAVTPIWVGVDEDSWGLDHGTWSVLVHAFADATVPVLQLSINAMKSIEEHVALGAALAPLRERGILVVGSGNVVHNLHRLDPRQPDGGFDWTHRFDAATRECMTTSPADVLALRDHADFGNAVPTPDHFIPLLYLAGLADAAGTGANVLVDGYSYGSLSMISYTLGATCPEQPPGANGSAALPDPDVVPPQDTNT